jgi:acyl carrier protein
MSTILHPSGEIAVITALLLIIGIAIWIYGSRAKKKFEAAFTGREPLDEQTFYEKYFQVRGVPLHVVVTIRRVLEDVLGEDMSRLRAEDDFRRNLSFFFEFDSMADVEIVERLQEEFNIEITNAEAERTHTVEDLVTLVWSKLR